MRKTAFLFAFVLVTPGIAAAPGDARAAGFGVNSLYGCDAAGSRDTTGAIIGGLVGGLAGSQISRNERALGAVAGAAIGAAIGNNIGCRMDRAARDQAQTAFTRALDTGQTQRWSDAQSGSSGVIEILDPPRPPYRDRPLRYGEGVARVDRLDGVPGQYEVDSRARVRAAPSQDAAVIDRLQVGEQVFAAGEAGPGWLAIVDDGVVRGYVSVSALRPIETAPPLGEGCRMVRETVTIRGYDPTVSRYTACRDERGAWRINQS